MIHKAARAAEPAQPILWVVVIEPAQAALVFNAIGSVERGTTVAILAWGHAVIVTLKCPFGQPQPESVRVLERGGRTGPVDLCGAWHAFGGVYRGFCCDLCGRR